MSVKSVEGPLKAVLDRVRAQGADGGEAINPFWAEELQDFKQAMASETPLSSHEMRDALGYADNRLGEGETNAAKFASLIQHDFAQEDAPTDVIEHAGALFFLQSLGLLDPYFALADRLGLESSLGLARHFWHANELRVTLKREEKPTPAVFLEIGAGGGQFAMLNALYGRVSHYVIVDLPAMLINSMTALSERFPDALVHFDEPPDFSGKRLTFWFLDTFNVKHIPDRSVDIATNFNSFMEMAGDIRDFYIAEIYRTARSGALFYNVNRRQRKMTLRDGEAFDNHPLLYPYRPTDRIIDWQPDPMQQSYRSRLFSAPIQSFAIKRMAEIA